MVGRLPNGPRVLTEALALINPSFGYAYALADLSDVACVCRYLH